MSALSENVLVEELRKINRDYDLSRGIHYHIRSAADTIDRLTKENAAQAAELAEERAKSEAAVEDAKMAVLSMLWMPGVRAALDNLPDDDPIEPYLEMARKGDEALAALRAAEEKAERLSQELASARLRPEPCNGGA